MEIRMTPSRERGTRLQKEREGTHGTVKKYPVSGSMGCRSASSSKHALQMSLLRRRRGRGGGRTAGSPCVESRTVTSSSSSRMGVAFDLLRVVMAGEEEREGPGGGRKGCRACTYRRSRKKLS